MAKAPPELVAKVVAEAHELLRALYRLDLLPAAEYVRDHPPSPEAIAMLAFYAHKLFTLEEQRARARGPRIRPGTIAQRLRDAGFTGASYAEVKEKAPELVEELGGKLKVSRALYNIKRKIRR
jgi:hypothetical protein